MKTYFHFESERWPFGVEALFSALGQSLPSVSDGRGKAHFFSLGGVDLVYKHYKRGGWIGRMIRDKYIYTGKARTRMALEYKLLQRLRALNLPVPEPVAARCVRHGFFCYSGDLVTRKLQNTVTLGSYLRNQPLADDGWAAVGEAIARFHLHDVYHADLNVENILLGPERQVALIDFDKSFIRPKRRQLWVEQNLQRLLRSFTKVARLTAERAEPFHFSMNGWHILLESHRSGMLMADEAKSSSR